MVPRDDVTFVTSIVPGDCTVTDPLLGDVYRRGCPLLISVPFTVAEMLVDPVVFPARVTSKITVSTAPPPRTVPPLPSDECTARSHSPIGEKSRCVSVSLSNIDRSLPPVFWTTTPIFIGCVEFCVTFACDGRIESTVIWPVV